MTDEPNAQGLTRAVQRYFDLMYDSDPARFDRVFCPTSQLHGLRQGQIAMSSAAAFKGVLAGRPSPAALKAPREEEILLMDFTSDDQAMVKVRVRMDATVFVDYLTYHRIDGDWMVTSKGYHVERNHPPAGA